MPPTLKPALGANFFVLGSAEVNAMNDSTKGNEKRIFAIQNNDINI